MRRGRIDDKEIIKKQLIELLKKEKAFWSYNNGSINSDSMSDELVIAYTMRFLDIEEINLLFSIYSFRKIKSAWRKLLLPEGEYLYTLNRFFAWYYFGIKNPDAYLKSFQTRYLNTILLS